MARKAGRNGVLYLSLDGTAAPSPITFLSKFSINRSVGSIDVTSFGDGNKVYVAGLPDSKGSVSGFLDSASTGTDALIKASVDGLARNFYFYPDSSAASSEYFYGSALWDFSMDTDVGGAVQVSSSWQAASTITFKGH